MDKFTSILPVLQTLLAICNIGVMLWAFRKFLNKPHDTLEESFNKLRMEFDDYKRATELKFQDIERASNLKSQEFTRSLQLGNEGFKEMRETSKVMQKCMLALIDFEISYCSNTHYNEDGIDNLVDAQKTLRTYLADK